MIEITGNLWEQNADVICITTNGNINTQGHAVMGKGNALEAKEKYPNIDKLLGENIRIYGNHVFPLVYTEAFKLYSFPTKHNWWEKSDINLIEKSCKDLVEWADENHWKKIILPRPGCGFGQLNWEEVKPILNLYFDDRFYIISKE